MSARTGAYHALPVLKGADAAQAGSSRIAEHARVPNSALGSAGGRRQFRLAPQPPFLRRDRENVTLLFGGLTQAHERLFKALLESRGFRVEVLPTPTLADYQTGRRYANNGFCNPLYFTGGSLINYLRTVEAEGMPRGEVSRRYVYVTSRSAGPCRLGLYEQEYRNLLENAGYAGFRVFAFSDTVSMRGGESEEGLPFDVHFYADLFSALMLGDILNDIANRTRPFERVEGSTDRAWEASIDYAEERLRARPPLSVWMEKHLPRWLRGPVEVVGRMLTWPMDARLLRVVMHARRQLRAVRIDPLRVRPAVKLIGEFWAQTTIGDGNFHAHRFLERHGAEVVVEPVTVWMLYLLFEADQKLRLRLQQLRHNRGRGPSAMAGVALQALGLTGQALLLRLAELFARLKYNLIRLCFNGIPDPLPGVYTFAALARNYYNPALLGGESHMEVGKTLYYTAIKRVHMVASLKPFGCMPSGMSDGVQPLLRAHHPDTLFLSIETSGEGSTNAQSRMLMVLSTARERALREYADALQKSERGGGDMPVRIARMQERAHALSRLRSRGVYACRAASELLPFAAHGTGIRR